MLLIEPTGRGGVSDYTAALAEALAGTGKPVIIATATDHLLTPTAGVAIRGLFPYVRDTGKVSRALRRSGAAPAINALRHLLATVRALRMARSVDVIHIQAAPQYPPLYAAQLLILRAAGRPIVVTRHNTFERGSRRHPRAQALADRLEARVVVHSRHDRSALSPRAAARAEVLPHGEYGGLARRGRPVSAAAAREQLRLPGEAPVALLFGQLRLDKGIGDLLEAALGIDELHLVIAGEDTGGLGAAAALLADERLANRLVVRSGFQDPDGTAQAFMASDVVVLPYQRASASGVLLLAYGFARAVVAYPVGGLPDYVEDGETGWLTARADPGALADTLRAVVAAGRAESARRGAAGRALSENRFAWPAIASATTALYDELTMDGA